MNNMVLCSTGALIGIPNGRNYRLLKELVPKLACDGIEFMLYSDWYDEEKELIAFLKELKVPIPVMHCQKTVGELITEERDEEAFRNFEANLRIAAAIGAGKMVMHLWNGRISDSNYPHSLTVYPKLRKMAGKYGIDLLIENVLCGVSTPMKRISELIESYPDAHIVFDTKMAEFHDELKLLYEPEYAFLYKDRHIRHYHVNDYGGGYMTWDNLKVLPVGAGHIDFDRFFEFVKKTGYTGTFTVEATAFGKDGIVDTDMLNRCFDRIREYLGE